MNERARVKILHDRDGGELLLVGIRSLLFQTDFVVRCRCNAMPLLIVRISIWSCVRAWSRKLLEGMLREEKNGRGRTLHEAAVRPFNPYRILGSLLRKDTTLLRI